MDDQHFTAEVLEGYSLLKLSPEVEEALECHLLTCAICRNRLAEIEPYNSVHYTEDGPFYSRITTCRDGVFWAHHWGCQIDGGRRHHDFVAAHRYLQKSFVEMFPGHECKGCSG